MKNNSAFFPQVLAALGVCVPLAVFLSTGLQGIDFGFHWDEEKILVLVRQTLQSGLFLPRWYRYPSFSYWLSLTALLPHVRAAVQQVGWDGHALLAHLLLVVETPAFFLQMRKVFLLVSSLTAVWVYIQGAVRRRGWGEALLAAGLVALSWEAAYHSRWIAPDALMMQFGALTLLLVTLALEKPEQRGWLAAAALSAGLACSTKYPGGLLLLPVLAAAFWRRPVAHLSHRLIAVVWVTLLFAAAYLLVTPGTLLEPVTFFKDIAYELRHYAGSYEAQTVSPGLPHLGLMLLYFSSALFSHSAPVGWVFFGLALLGIYALLRESRLKALVFLCFPVVYVGYFSTQGVMSVRNLLVTLRFWAVQAGRGAALVWGWLPLRTWRFAWAGLLAGLLVLNALWLVSAAQSIRLRGTDAYLRQFNDYAARNPQVTFYLSEPAWQAWEKLGQGGEAARNVRRLADVDVNLPAAQFCQEQNGRVVAFAQERKDVLVRWGKDDLGEFIPTRNTQIFGAWDVNFIYYPLWAGEDRLLVLHTEKACRLGVYPAAALRAP